MRMRRLAFVTATAMLVVPATAFAAHPVHRVVHRAPANPGYTVPMDEARVITFERPIATVFVGNTTIADITIIDSRHAYLLGKTFGVTNMIGLDIDHNTVLNKQVAVVNRSGGSVTLNRGADTFNYSCTSFHCETNPRPGDPNTYVTNTTGTATAHEDTAIKAAAASNSPSQ